MKKYSSPLILWLLFETVAVALWRLCGDPFYFFNFSYIGSSIAIGLTLYIRRCPWARQMVQFAVGLYMLVYLGLLSHENMQIEGFWYYLFLGVFEAAVIHYVVAKLLGPLVFGRGWCGYACWTAMVLDLLPFKTPQGPRKKWGKMRYFVFLASLLFVAALFLFQVKELERVMWWSFIAGNLLYYAAGIALAYICKDNRAFCKYVCPVTVFLKPMSYPSLFRIQVDMEKCVSCGKCEKVCPMDVQVPSNSRKKKNATECILCMRCAEECPVKAIKL